MKNVLTGKFSSILKILGVMSLAVLLLRSCSRDDDDDNNNQNGNSYKVTVTIPNVEAANNNALDDYVSIIVGGSTGDPSVTTLWKVNGTEIPAELVTSLDEDDFEGATKTYVIESIRPLMLMQVKLQIINNNMPLSVSYKIEKNGKTEIEQNVTLADDEDHTKTYNL